MIKCTIKNIDTKEKGKKVRQIIESVQKGLGFPASDFCKVHIF